MKSKLSKRDMVKALAAIGVMSVIPVQASASGKVIRMSVNPTMEVEVKAVLAAKLLRDRLQYEVELIPLQRAIEYASLGNGTVDVLTSGYLRGDGPFNGVFEGGHANFVNPIASRITVLGRAAGPGDEGFVVPSYVDAVTIDDLIEKKDRFDETILGGDPAWGISEAADQALQEYDLPYRIIYSSEEAMVAGLQAAITRNEWVVITGWRPHMIWAKFDLRYIEDPKNVFGEEPHWHYVLGREGFEEDFPEATAFFKKFALDNDDVANLTYWIIEDDLDSDQAADRWIEENEAKIEDWLSP